MTLDGVYVPNGCTETEARIEQIEYRGWRAQFGSPEYGGWRIDPLDGRRKPYQVIEAAGRKGV